MALKFVICGLEHSGTTMLSDIFRQVPGVYSGFEGGVLLCNSPREFLNLQPYYENMTVGWEIRPEDLAACCDTDDFSEFYRRLQSGAKILKEGTQDIFDKTPRYFRDIRASYEKVRVPFVATYRDPRGIVFADYKRHANGGDFQAWYQGYKNGKLAVLKGIYNKSYLPWKRNRETKRFAKILCVSLEEFCLNSQAVLARTFNHVGLDFNNEYCLLRDRKYLRQVRADHVSADIPFEYLKAFTREQLLMIEKDFSELEDWFVWSTAMLTPPMNVNIPSDLKVSLLESCFVSPLRPVHPDKERIYPRQVRFIGGIYDSLGKPHPDSLLKRSGELVQAYECSYMIKRDAAKRIMKKAIYGGIIFDHYGHFLLESLARAWYLHAGAGDVYFYRARSDKKDSTYNDFHIWQRTILKHLLGDLGRIKIINAPLVFDELIVPDVGYLLRSFCSQAQVDALSLLGSRITAGYNQGKISDKIWLSRSLLTKACVAGEKRLEEALFREGFCIVHPERRSLAEQIMLFEESSVVAGFAGSAFHTALLAKSRGSRLLIFERERNLNENYVICAKAATRFRMDFYNFFLRYGKRSGAHANVFLDLSAVWNVLYAQGLVRAKEYFDPGIAEDLERLDVVSEEKHPKLFA